MIDDDGRTLYRELIEAWNRRDAAAYAAFFAADGAVVGFDGSQMTGPAEIENQLAAIFRDHPTGRYVTLVRRVRPLGADVTMVQAVAGMIPAGASDLEPKLHTVQSLVAEREGAVLRIALFQNTPAQLHGRPEAVQQLTAELRAVLRESLP